MDDDDVQEYESSGWRKRQINNRDANNIRNATLEEVAREIEKMKAFGQDTIASFAVHIRSMKR